MSGPAFPSCNARDDTFLTWETNHHGQFRCRRSGRGAFYELYGKDKLTPLLENAKKKAESFGGFMKNVGKKAGGGLDAVFGGLKGKAAELGIEFLKYNIRAAGELTTEVDKLRKEYEKTGRVIAAVDAAVERNIKRRGELIEAEIDPKKKALAIDKEIAKVEKERAAAQVLKEQFEDQKDRLGTYGKKGTIKERWESANIQGHGAIFGGPGLEGMLNDVQQQIDAQNAARDKAFARLQELSEQRGRLLSPDNDPEKMKAVAELTRELKKQADTFQQTADAIKLYELAQQNFSKKQIAAIAAAQEQTKLYVTLGGAAGELSSSVGGAAKDLTEEIKETTKALREQAETFGLSAEQATLYKLKLKGVREEALAGARVEVGRIELLNKLAGAADAIANGVASAERLTLASPGSFDGGNAAQRFGADTLSQKTIKAAETTAKNTTDMVKGLAQLAKGLRFK